MKLIVLMLILLFGFNLNKSENKYISFQDHLKKVCKEYKVSYNDMMRIAFIESSFRADALNKNKNGTVDVGLFQINSIHHNTTCAGLNVYTVKGNVYCAVKLVAGLKKYKAVDKHWLARYHSKTRSKKLAYVNKLNKITKELL